MHFAVHYQLQHIAFLNWRHFLDIAFLNWEGHFSIISRQYGVPSWTRFSNAAILFHIIFPSISWASEPIKCWLSISRSLPWAYVLCSHDHTILEFVLILELFRYIFNIFGALTGSWWAMGAPRTSHWAQNRISIDLEAILDSKSGGFSAITSQNSYIFCRRFHTMSGVCSWIEFSRFQWSFRHRFWSVWVNDSWEHENCRNAPKYYNS